MLVLRKVDDVVRVVDPRVRALVELRFSQVSGGEPFDSDAHGYFVVAEPGDRAEDLEAEIGLPILRDTFGKTRFGNPDFVPAAEVSEDHGVYELAYVLNDDGFVVVLFVPKTEGVDPELRAMCEAHAIPSEETSGR